MGRKYDALGQFLKAHAAQGEVRLTFGEIEKIIGSKLPASAYDHRPWWSNNPSNNVMTEVWLAAGFATEQVDMEAQKLVFQNRAKKLHEFDSTVGMPKAAAGIAHGLAEQGREFQHVENKHPRRHPAFGALKGTFTIEPGWDLARPSLDPDELEEMEANIDHTADLIEQGMKGKKQ